VESNHVFGAGHFYGVTFNDAGSGPLHNRVRPRSGAPP
jgi:hypothetical protein